MYSPFPFLLLACIEEAHPPHEAFECIASLRDQIQPSLPTQIRSYPILDHPPRLSYPQHPITPCLPFPTTSFHPSHRLARLFQTLSHRNQTHFTMPPSSLSFSLSLPSFVLTTLPILFSTAPHPDSQRSLSTFDVAILLTPVAILHLATPIAFQSILSQFSPSSSLVRSHVYQ